MRELEVLSFDGLKQNIDEKIKTKTEHLADELNHLLVQKEQIDIAIEKKMSEIQDAKYMLFAELESEASDESYLSKLHQIKLQSIDLYDVLSETTQSAIIEAIERYKASEAFSFIEEMIKELTYETIKEGELNTLRVRKILSTILNASIEVAEATPNQLDGILESSLRGMRSGLVLSIDRFKKRLEFMPLEAKHILIRDYDTIMQDLNHTDVIFSQVIYSSANESESITKKALQEINNKMRYDLEELVHISKETAIAMKKRFSSFAKAASKKADSMLHSKTANEAKKMGQNAISAAKIAVANAIKNAKSKMEPKE
ncbi:MAG: DUF6781 family protein [Sulfurimonas sp.]|jgi:hypothetical protein|nr:hypothetical protein [Sulfurimonadaceae bacterium]